MPAQNETKTYRDLCEAERAADAGLRAILEILPKTRGKRVLVFSHDDPDGITSAAICRRLLEGFGAAEVAVRMPTRYNLEPEEVEEEKKKGPWDLLVVTDKGTLASVDAAAALVPQTIVVDHHFTPAPPERPVIYNPTLRGGGYVSASYLWHVVATLLERATPADDLDALVGMKADFAIDPAKKFDGSPLAAPGTAYLRKSFPNLFKIVPKVATLFDSGARDRTSLLSQIAEVYFAVSGGGFQFFYGHADPALAGIDPPAFLLEEARKIAAKAEAVRKVKTLANFLALFPGRKKVDRILSHFRADWERAPGMVRAAVPVARVVPPAGPAAGKKIDVYLFVADRLTLLPFVGGVVLDEFVRRDGVDAGIILMVNREPEGGVHFCLRGTSEWVHVGKICSALSKRLNERWRQPKEISGGGHAKAGECRTRYATGVSYREALRICLDLLAEVESKGGTDHL